MRIGGLQKLTLLDFPQKVACTVFLAGCNFRCPFCHNTPLLSDCPTISEDELLNFLRKRQGMLDGVAITGGEPLMNPDLTPLLQKIKDLDYAIKIDTNGAFPDHLRRLIDTNLVNYVAMDIKNSPEKYEMTAGVKGILPSVQESVELLKSGKIPYEFRTTIVDELHEPDDFHAIGNWIAGADAYYLQGFVDSGNILLSGMHAASEEKMASCLAIASRYISNTHIRGL